MTFESILVLLFAVFGNPHSVSATSDVNYIHTRFNASVTVCFGEDVSIVCGYDGKPPNDLQIKIFLLHSSTSLSNVTDIVLDRNFLNMHPEIAHYIMHNRTLLMESKSYGDPRVETTLELSHVTYNQEGYYLCRIGTNNQFKYRIMLLKVRYFCSFRNTLVYILPLLMMAGLLSAVLTCKLMPTETHLQYKRVIITSSQLAVAETDVLESRSSNLLYHLSRPPALLQFGVHLEPVKDSSLSSDLSKASTPSNGDPTRISEDGGYFSFEGETALSSQPSVELKDWQKTVYIFPRDSSLEVEKATFCDLKPLGLGAFGKVYLALASHLPNQVLGPRPVAIKSMKHDCSDEDVINFAKEMEILKRIGHNEHVVQLFATCTQEGPPWLIFEYAEKGDLQSYLKSREFLFKEISPCEVKSTFLTYCKQAALGMEFLASRHIVHRDLAARNVLVFAPETLKITDFGLSRKADQYYRMTKSGRVPIKWMAPESIRDRIFSTKSDVWSFGVLMWEVFSCGQTPFPDTSPRQYVRVLLSGGVNCKPLYADDAVYNLMCLCWSFWPPDRPYFHKLVATLSSQLSEPH